MAIFDAAHRAEFADRIGYELWLLDDYRAQLFRQSEGADHVMSLHLSRDAAGTEQLSDGLMSMNFAASMSDRDVAATLSRFRVAAFASAFKMHDMLVEWLLAASMSAPPPHQFKQKHEKLTQLGASLMLPPELDRLPEIREWLRESYARMSTIRNPTIHQGGVQIHPDGAFDVRDKHGAMHRVDYATQSAYARFACIVCRQICAPVLSDDIFEQLVRADIAVLLPARSIVPPRMRVASLEVRVDPAMCSSTSPCRVDVPLAAAVGHMAVTTPVPGGTLFLELAVVVELDDRKVRWELPTRDWSAVTSIALDEADPSLHVEVEVRARPAGA